MPAKSLTLLVGLLWLSSNWALAAETGEQAAAKPSADATQANEPPAGHSMHGEAFNEGPRQKPYLMHNTGNVRFEITTSVPEAQQYFDQGLGQLHGFWYFEAERSFREVARLDPACAMAYWGMAMANDNNEKRAKEFIKKAVEKKALASPREAAWIDALAAWHDAPNNIEKRQKYVRDLEAIVHDYPNDVEARAFLALQIWKNGSWMTEGKRQIPISSHQAVDAILDQVFDVNPMHPAHHYRIHLWDREKPARALISASRCGQASPGIAHTWHMSGHIYSRLHRYVDAAWQQEASARVDHAHMMRDGVLPDQIHNYAHNNEWLIRNLAYLGRVHDAIDLAENMISLPRHPKYNTRSKRGTSAAYGHDRLEDVLVQYECWQDLLGPRGRPLMQNARGETDPLKQARLTGLASFGLGNVEAGREQIAALEEMLAEKQAARIQSADEAEAKARSAKKSESDVAKAMADALKPHGRAIRQVEEAVSELRAYAALADGNEKAALAELKKLEDAGGVRKDHLARLFSLAGDHAKAKSLAKKLVDDGPGQVYPRAVLVEVLYRAGEKEAAREAWADLRPLAAYADLDAAVFRRLRPIAEEFGLPEDWRGSQAPSVDVGGRPELSSLGPFRWSPTPAPSWTLPGAEGGNVSLADYRGRPVIVIFYLGSGCLHCVEQIQKFAPLTSEFGGEGVSLVAISSEPLDTLKGSLEKLSPGESIPFPLAADPEMNIFRAYRAYDDFENMPLHGTFLVDADGLVRWQDISYEPFVDVKFLLGEAKRLLSK